MNDGYDAVRFGCVGIGQGLAGRVEERYLVAQLLSCGIVYLQVDQRVGAGVPVASTECGGDDCCRAQEKLARWRFYL